MPNRPNDTYNACRSRRDIKSAQIIGLLHAFRRNARMVAPVWMLRSPRSQWSRSSPCRYSSTSTSRLGDVSSSEGGRFGGMRNARTTDAFRAATVSLRRNSILCRKPSIDTCSSSRSCAQRPRNLIDNVINMLNCISIKSMSSVHTV